MCKKELTEEIMAEERRRKTIVIGHKNPDTDSICCLLYTSNQSRQSDRLAQQGRMHQLRQLVQSHQLAQQGRMHQLRQWHQSHPLAQLRQ